MIVLKQLSENVNYGQYCTWELKDFDGKLIEITPEKQMTTVLVCGGRDFTDHKMLNEELNDYHRLYGPITRLVHGGARGADNLAGLWALNKGIQVKIYKAKWDLYGPSAGPRRNQEMLDKEKPDKVIVFPGGKGTAHMMRIAIEQGYYVLEISNVT